MSNISSEILAIATKAQEAQAKAIADGRLCVVHTDTPQPVDVYGATRPAEDSDNVWKFRRCGVPKLFAEKTFDNYEGNDRLIAHIRTLGPDDSVIISGNTGCGKTHLAVALMRKSGLREDQMIFAECIQFMDTIKDSYKDQAPMSTSELMRRHMEIPLLVLDDLGAEQATPNAKEKIAQLIKGRDANMRRTIITTNLELEALENRYDARTSSRMSVMEYIQITSMPDYRKKKVRKRVRPANVKLVKGGNPGDNEGSTTAEAVK